MTSRRAQSSSEIVDGEHASLKTQVKLLMKKKKVLNVSMKPNKRVVSSWRTHCELVALLEAERSMHLGKMNELKHDVKHKFSKLKKRRVPVDAAYKASLMLYALTYQHYSMQL